MMSKENIQEQLRGWGFDINDLKEEGAFSSPPKVTRAFSTKVSNDPTPTTNLKEEEWCHYGGLPGPKAYM